jgi:hypothetical protein
MADSEFAHLIARINTAITKEDWLELQHLSEQMRYFYPLSEVGYKYGVIACSGTGDFAASESILTLAMRQFPDDLNYAYSHALNAESAGAIPEARLRWESLAHAHKTNSFAHLWVREFMSRHGHIFDNRENNPLYSNPVSLYEALLFIAKGDFQRLPAIWDRLDKGNIDPSLIKVCSAILRHCEIDNRQFIREVISVLVGQKIDLNSEEAPEVVIVILEFKLKKSKKADFLIEVLNDVIICEDVETDTAEICALVFEVPLPPHRQMNLVCRWILEPGYVRFSHMFGNNGHVNVSFRSANYFIGPLVNLLIDSNAIKNLSISQVYRLACVLYCLDRFTFTRLATHCSTWTSIPEEYTNAIFGSHLFQIAKSLISADHKSVVITNSPPLRKLRVALCVSGQLRGFKEAIKSWGLLGLHEHDVDTYVHVWKVIGRRFPDALQAHRIFKEPFLSAYKHVYFQLSRKGIEDHYPHFSSLFDGHEEIELNDLENAYNTTNIVIEDDRDLEFRHFNTVLKMHYKIERCYEMIERSGKAYDLVIRIRPDICVDAERELDLNKLYERSKCERMIFSDFPPIISSGIVTWQLGECLPLMIGDLIAIGTPELMSVYAKTYSNNISSIARDVFGLPKGLAPHTSIALLLMGSGIFVDTTPEILSQNVCDPEPVPMESVKRALEKDMAKRSHTAFDIMLLDALGI